MFYVARAMEKFRPIISSPKEIRIKRHFSDVSQKGTLTSTKKRVYLSYPLFSLYAKESLL